MQLTTLEKQHATDHKTKKSSSDSKNKSSQLPQNKGHFGGKETSAFSFVFTTLTRILAIYNFAILVSHRLAMQHAPFQTLRTRIR